MKPLQIVVLEGTTRVKRDSIHAARLVAEIIAPGAGVNVNNLAS